MSYGISTFLINPNGSFLPITYDDHPDWIVGAPASVNLNSVNLQGQFIKVKRQGAASLGVSWPDNTIYFNTIAVFTNGNLQIPAGDGTTAPGVGAYNFCPTSIFAHEIDLPYDLNIGGYPYINEQTYKLRVPLNATNLLIAPYDCPIQDNSDPDQNYKLEIRFPIVEKVDIYQVVKNPRLNSPSTYVDLVAGKNADIVIKTAPNVNVEGSYVEWPDTFGNTNNKIFFSTATSSDATTGEVAFQIDPVPSSANYLNGVTRPKIYLRTRNSNGTIVDSDMSESYDIETYIRKTKPMRLGFVPISGCIDDKPGQAPCFSAPTSTDVTNMAKHGGDIMKAMYPVAESDFSTSIILNSDKGFFVPRYFGASASEIKADVSQLNKSREMFFSRDTDFIVGVISESYREKRILKFDKTGNSESVKKYGVVGLVESIPTLRQSIVEPKVNRALFVTKDYYFALPHEVGHGMSLTHQCQNINPGISCPDEKNTFDGYNSSILSSDWVLPRGKVGDRDSLMRDKSQFPLFTNPEISIFLPWMKNKWVAYSEYINLFIANMNYSRADREKKLRTNSGAISVSIEINQNDYILTNFYFKPAGSIFTYNPQFGEYQVDILNSSGNLLYTNYVNALNNDEIENKILDFDIPIVKTAMFIKLYKLNAGVKTLVKFLSIPAEIVQEEIKFLDPKTVNVDLGQFKNSVANEIKRYDDKLKCQNYPAARSQLSNKILSIVSQKMSVLNLPNSLNMDKNKFESVILNSLTRVVFPLLNSNDFYNPFIDGCLEIIGDGQSKKSKITIEFNRQPEDKEYGYTATVQFENTEIELIPINEKFFAETIPLVQGLRYWKVSTFMVNKKIYQGILNSIKQIKKTLLALNDQLNNESDPDARIVIQKKISAQQRQLDGLVVEKKNEEKQISQPQFFNFEVL